MNSNAGNLIGFIAIVIFMFLVFIFDRPSNSSPSSVASPQVQTSNAGHRTPSLISSGPWPPLSEADSSIVSEKPLATNYYVILDASGSMREVVGGDVKMDAARKALSVFGDGVPSDANVGLMSFSPVREHIKLGAHQSSLFSSQVSRISPGGGTPLVASIKRGFDALTQQAASQSGYGRYILLVVTDGRSSDGNPSQLAREIVQNSAVEVVVIGFGLDDHALNMPGVTEYHVANSIDDLIRALEDVVASETESFVDPTDFSSAL